MERYEIKLPPTLSLTEDEFFALCQENRDLRFERNANGEIIIMAPTGGITGDKNGELVADLKLWNRHTQLGKVFDSSTGFILPNGATRSPDASWLERSRWEALTEEQQATFVPLCPDFVAELMSPSDILKTTQAKIQEWMDNGCRLGWLFYPPEEQTFVYRTGQAKPETVIGYDRTLSGEEVLPNFAFDLQWLK
ncbi:Uma2 family endonuclease [Tunicatimonas pelagia]|uniref:Uma2 family endonuclease n=1 Tax=Tunicatimonas pelagia TaxID=931531 RepID=UPI002666CA26|nr:Uma2 family endonuclease [Tunicatimonas pelagia]WKN45685.1 Uma2 family endonuclease [Tunicatimonas pelagia]